PEVAPQEVTRRREGTLREATEVEQSALSRQEIQGWNRAETSRRSPREETRGARLPATSGTTPPTWTRSAARSSLRAWRGSPPPASVPTRGPSSARASPTTARGRKISPPWSRRSSRPGTRSAKADSNHSLRARHGIGTDLRVPGGLQRL